MAKNNLYTLSYFRKRLFENEIKSIKLIDHYSADDNRKWTILIYPNDKNILCTCHKIMNDKTFWFTLQTKSLMNYVIKTKSMDVMIDTLKLIDAPINSQSTPQS